MVDRKNDGERVSRPGDVQADGEDSVPGGHRAKRQHARAGGMDQHYLQELQNLLESEAEMARQGVDLLNDPEYRSLRELYIDGDIDQQEFLERVEALAESRPEEGSVTFSALDEAEAALAGIDDDEQEDGPDDEDALDRLLSGPRH